VSELQALAAIRRGDHIAIKNSNSLLNLAAVKFAKPPEIPDTSFRIQMAYRQAGLFMTFLRDTNPVDFSRMMNAILDGRPFTEAATTGYETELHTLWLHFVQAAPAPSMTGVDPQPSAGSSGFRTPAPSLVQQLRWPVSLLRNTRSTGRYPRSSQLRHPAGRAAQHRKRDGRAGADYHDRPAT
jgi:hypothetical protein